MLVSKAAPPFRPITITLENQDELDSLRFISSLNATVAKAVSAKGLPQNLTEGDINTFLSLLYEALPRA